ncbi:MAG: thiol-activated cytolysin family protein [Bacteroidota bacterium]
MKKIACRVLSISILLLVFNTSCKKEDVTTNDPQTFQEVIDNAGAMPDPTESETSETLGTTTEMIDGQNWTCTTEQQSIETVGGGNEGFPLFSPNSDVIYPGNLLQGNSLNLGTPKIIAVERAGGTISTDVLDGNIEPERYVEAIKKSSVITAINQIIDGSTGVLPANFYMKVKNIQSREQLALELGVDVNSSFVDIESKLGYSSDTQKNTFMVNLNQTFYTMSYDIPTSLDQIFAPSVTPDDLGRYVGEGNPATYISSVTYGRIFYMLIESTSSRTEMDAAINASFNGVTTDVEVDMKTNYVAELDELSITVFAYGGEASSSLMTVGKTQLDELATLLAEGSDIRAGKPISYVVRSAYDNQIVATQLATTYDVTNCVISGAGSPPPYTEHWTGEIVSQMGPVGAAFKTGGSETEFVLVSEDGTQFLRSDLGTLEGTFSINEMFDSPFPIETIGAARRVNGYNQPHPYRFQFYDKSGFQNVMYNPFDNTWGSVNTGATAPFDGVGIGAFTSKSATASDMYFFNKEGNKWTVFNSNTPGNSRDLWEWGASIGSSQSDPLLVFNIGAATGYTSGSGNIFYILFDKGGTRYQIYGRGFAPVTSSNPNGIGTIGPFDL